MEVTAFTLRNRKGKDRRNMYVSSPLHTGYWANVCKMWAFVYFVAFYVAMKIVPRALKSSGTKEGSKICFQYDKKMIPLKF